MCGKMIVQIITSLCIAAIANAAYISFINMPAYRMEKRGGALTSKVSHPLKPGQMLLVYGRMNHDTTRMGVNLMRGAELLEEPGAEAVFHLDVRFSEARIIMNTLTQSWGREERVRNPFKKGMDFHLIIRANGDIFEIWANHRRIYKFRMRLPLSSVEYVTVTGDATVKGVSWSGPEPIALPLITEVGGGHFLSGGRFTVYGKPNGGNFEIVLNAKVGGTWGAWGPEELGEGFPFKKDVIFDLTFLNAPESIQVYSFLFLYLSKTNSKMNDNRSIRML
ncbi:unnamed protein product [Anisakis simplex]|uniref:Galectin n=1 Tax=Anisakis simplex TaxID=6269 RepID=A0A0M3IZA9_ANISI|nr:unnamed protein product [Anisakis simplex]